MELTIFTWNVHGNLDGKKGETLLPILEQKKIDIFVFQEISQDPKDYIADLKKKKLSSVYETHHWERPYPYLGGGGYALILKKNKFSTFDSESDAAFDFPIKTLNQLDKNKPNENRPPLRLELEDKRKDKIILYTWHAPNDGQEDADGTLTRARLTIDNWKGDQDKQDELKKAQDKDYLWILAGDLNVTTTYTSRVFSDDKHYHRIAPRPLTKSPVLDHVIAKYGTNEDEQLELRMFTLKPIPTGSDHPPLAVTVKYGV